MRILFGDKEAYLDKFKTSCRTRPIETQLLGTAYYMKEHTKPIFHKHKILAFKNLYNYQICLETLEILKSKIPYYFTVGQHADIKPKSHVFKTFLKWFLSCSQVVTEFKTF